MAGRAARFEQRVSSRETSQLHVTGGNMTGSTRAHLAAHAALFAQWLAHLDQTTDNVAHLPIEERRRRDAHRYNIVSSQLPPEPLLRAKPPRRSPVQRIARRLEEVQMPLGRDGNVVHRLDRRGLAALGAAEGAKVVGAYQVLRRGVHLCDVEVSSGEEGGGREGADWGTRVARRAEHMCEQERATSM